MMTIDDIITEVKTKKTDAVLYQYHKGFLYYTLTLSSGTFVFPIPIIDGENISFNKQLRLSQDIGDTPFKNAMPARLLISWIEKAVIKKQFKKLNIKQ